jgi:hypothetical protein
LDTSGNWTTLSLPAIAEADEVIQIGKNEFHPRKAGEALHPEREPLEILKKLQSEIGSYDSRHNINKTPSHPMMA